MTFPLSYYHGPLADERLEKEAIDLTKVVLDMLRMSGDDLAILAAIRRTLVERGQTVTEPRPWRIGKHYNIHVYEGDRPVATFHDAADAARCVEAMTEFKGLQMQFYMMERENKRLMEEIERLRVRFQERVKELEARLGW